ncbi:MAG: hypothetical protein ACRDPF_26505, partial [Streptosporangiaceae bacterium]
SILLCPLELEALTWQDHDLFSRLLQTPHAPEDPPSPHPQDEAASTPHPQDEVASTPYPPDRA